MSLRARIGVKTGFAREDSIGKLDSKAKLDSPSEQRPRKRKPSQGKGNGLIVRPRDSHFPRPRNFALATLVDQLEISE